MIKGWIFGLTTESFTKEIGSSAPTTPAVSAAQNKVVDKESVAKMAKLK